MDQNRCSCSTGGPLLLGGINLPHNKLLYYEGSAGAWRWGLRMVRGGPATGGYLGN